MLPAGVETRTPSETRFLITNFLLFFIVKLAACLLCLKIETSLIAIHFFDLFLKKTVISKGDIDIIFDFLIFWIKFFENLFIKKP